jgi:hypothetical protein
MTDIGAVIGWKHNHQAGMSTRDGVITEFPGGIPSQEDQDKWTKEYEAYLLTIAYVDSRKKEYPAIGEQLDLLWHAIDDGTLDKTSDFYTSLKATKDKYPKT